MLVAVKIVRPAGRSILTALARRRGGWGAEAAGGVRGRLGAGSVGFGLWLMYRQGWRGVLATSAARPAGPVLVVFLPVPAIPAELVPAGYTRVSQPPAPPTGMHT